MATYSDEDAQELDAKIASLDDDTLIEMMTGFLQPAGWADGTVLAAVNDFTALTARTLWCEVASRFVPRETMVQAFARILADDFESPEDVAKAAETVKGDLAERDLEFAAVRSQNLATVASIEARDA